jgi:hypothetical protein
MVHGYLHAKMEKMAVLTFDEPLELLKQAFDFSVLILELLEAPMSLEKHICKPLISWRLF